MKLINVEGSQGIIRIVVNDLGGFVSVDRPLSVCWYDCGGSVAKFLAMLPHSPEARDLIATRIRDTTQDCTGLSEETLLSVIDPLLPLFENGEYLVEFANAVVTDEENHWGIVGNTTLYTSNTLIYSDMMRYWRPGNEDKYYMPSITDHFYDGVTPYYVATRPTETLDPRTIDHYAEKIKSGKRPFGIVLCGALMFPNETEPQSYETSFVLDGHHKFHAYQRLGMVPPALVITRIFRDRKAYNFTPAELDRLAAWLLPPHIHHMKKNWNSV